MSPTPALPATCRLLPSSSSPPPLCCTSTKRTPMNLSLGGQRTQVMALELSVESASGSRGVEPFFSFFFII